MSIDHHMILRRAKRTTHPDLVPIVESLHQNLAMIVPLKEELEARYLRMERKLNRYALPEDEEIEALESLDELIGTIAHSIQRIRHQINRLRYAPRR